MTARRKHRPNRPQPQWSYLYDGRDLLAVIERKSDGWHVLIRGRDVGTCIAREGAIALANKTKQRGAT